MPRNMAGISPPANEEERQMWERAFQRVKQETVPLLMLSKKFYQATEEVTP